MFDEAERYIESQRKAAISAALKGYFERQSQKRRNQRGSVKTPPKQNAVKTAATALKQGGKDYQHDGDN